MTDSNGEALQERLRHLAQDLSRVTMTAEVWPVGGDGEDIDQATVVDVVRVDDRLHFVVVLDGS